ncbi:MAG TPA: MarR family winged helix-turn-helix transcriptional regulator [Acidimicrobiales bacterium]|nr:MarR family winged helix-turn-helix transcriptional regulator [Acidimicrobiales bacterium]
MPPPFGDSVGFLLSQLGYVVARRFRAVMAEVDLEPRHFALLRAIEANEGQSQSVLVERLRIPASSMVSVVDYLEERGLVERRVPPGDRRARTLHLTAAGRDLAAHAAGRAMAFERELCRGLDDATRRELIERLQRIGRNLEVVEGVHPDVALGHHAPSWTESAPLG